MPAMVERKITFHHNDLRFSAVSCGPTSAACTVLLLHGFPDTYHTFVHQMRALSHAGHCAIALVMPGYEPSSLATKISTKKTSASSDSGGGGRSTDGSSSGGGGGNSSSGSGSSDIGDRYSSFSNNNGDYSLLTLAQSVIAIAKHLVDDSSIDTEITTTATTTNISMSKTTMPYCDKRYDCVVDGSGDMVKEEKDRYDHRDSSSSSSKERNNLLKNGKRRKKRRQIHLVGHDWGAAVACVSAALSPSYFASLTQMAVPHPGRFARQAPFIPLQLARSWYMLAFQLPVLAEWLVQANDYAFVRWLWQAWSPFPTPPSPPLPPPPAAAAVAAAAASASRRSGGSSSIESNDGSGSGCGYANNSDYFYGRDFFLDAAVETLKRPGVLSATLGYYRAALSPHTLLSSPTEANFTVHVPCMGLCGVKDGCIGADVFNDLMQPSEYTRGLELHTLENCGHFLHQERPHQVNSLLLDWIARHA